MRDCLSIRDLAIWLIEIAGTLVLSSCVLKKGVTRRLPWFSAYVFGLTGKHLLLLALTFWSSYSAYYTAFYATGYIVSALAFFTLIECGSQVLPGLRAVEKERALSWLLLVFGAVAVFSFLWPMHFVESRIEVAGCLAIAATFFFIAAYARYLGFYWSQLLAGITTTLGFLYATEGVAKALMAHYPPAVAVRFRPMSEVAGFLAVVAWTIVILSPWGEYDITQKELSQARRIIDDAEDNLRHAAGGAK